MYNKFKLFKETTDFIIYLYPEINKFPKSDKFTLGEDIKKTTLSFYTKISLYAKYKTNFLKEADIDLDLLRLYIRLSFNLKIISFRKYEIISRKINDIGKLLGGLLKQNK